MGVKMKKILSLIALLIGVIFIFGCQNPVTNSSTDWCKKETQWNAAMAKTEQSGTKTSWLIEGIMTSGEYQGMCHIVYTSEGKDVNAKADYYISKDGKSGYLETVVNGQTFKQQWTG